MEVKHVLTLKANRRIGNFVKFSVAIALTSCKFETSLKLHAGF